ncbi:hypothetical protein J2Y48_002196 [Mycoplana sp. BE70]|uniref:hypothetical protein n=1 Tax=Mycoplana sp. BE70 TaxID=2817775 RepID=UPI00285C8714|nr:hypothetical protein [Mycoplana sp. BE70]MDR6756900.1 hypothetical protein [Mycoplana sp. BE70]
MSWLPVAATVYLVGAVFFFACTYLEGMRRVPAWDFHRFIGLAASAVWPLVIAYVWLISTDLRKNAAAIDR